MTDFLAFASAQIVHVTVSVWEGLIHPMMLVIYVFTALFLLLDGVRRGWTNCLTRKMMTGISATFLIIVLNALFVPMVLIWVDELAVLYDSLGIPHLPETTWNGVPFWLSAFVGIVFADLADYLNHRAMHTKWLWPIHAMHHSDHEVNGLTTFRVHAFEAFFMKASYVLLLTWLGMPAEAQAAGAAMLLLHNVYVHARVDWTHGPFRLLVASPRFHLWHHADVPEAHGKNLANVIPLWDWLGGTYLDGGPCTVPTGAKGVPHSDVVALMSYPFVQWGRYLRRHSAR